MDPVALLTTFSLVFLAELGDKTALAILLLSSRGRPLPVFLGACAAFLLQGLVALGLGALLGKLPPAAVRYGTALVFLGFGLLLLFAREEDERAPPQPAPDGKLFAQSFGLVFVAEFGDATQIASAALVARLSSPWAVFAGATLALCSVAALMVLVGRLIGPRLPAALLRRLAGGLFVAFAVLSVLRG